MTTRKVRKETVGGAVLAVTGGGLIYRRVTARRSASGGSQRRTGSAEHPETGAPDSAPELTRTLTIGKSTDELFRLWRDPQTLPLIMQGIAEVKPDGPDNVDWTFHGPLGSTFAWRTQVTEDRPGQSIQWKSVEGAQVANEGSVEFRPAPRDLGTEVTLRIRFDPPGGVIGEAALKLARSGPNLMVGKVLRRFKNLAETGEIPTTTPQPAARADND